jgi:hypothetical protein
MARLLRCIVILCATLAFIVTSVGWGATGALMGLKADHHGLASVTTDKADHHHGDFAADLAASCSDAKDCGSKAWHEDVADACCGTACHIATEAGGCRQVLIPIARALNNTLLDDEIKEGTFTRLERPPRSIIG